MYIKKDFIFDIFSIKYRNLVDFFLQIWRLQRETERKVPNMQYFQSTSSANFSRKICEKSAVKTEPPSVLRSDIIYFICTFVRVWQRDIIAHVCSWNKIRTHATDTDKKAIRRNTSQLINIRRSTRRREIDDLDKSKPPIKTTRHTFPPLA